MKGLPRILASLLLCGQLGALTVDPERYNTMVQLSPSSFQRLDDYRSSMTPKLSGIFVAMDAYSPGSGTSGGVTLPYKNADSRLKYAFLTNFGAGGSLYAFKRRAFLNFGFCYATSSFKTETMNIASGVTDPAADATGRRTFYRDTEISGIETQESFGYGEIGLTNYLRLTAGGFYRTQPLTAKDASGRSYFDYAFTSSGTVTTSTAVTRGLYGVNVMGVQLDSLIKDSELNNMRGYYGFPIGNGTELRPVVNYFRFQDKYQAGLEIFDIKLSKRFRVSARVLGSKAQHSEFKFSMASTSLRWYFFRGVTTEFTLNESDGSKFITTQTWSAYLEASLSHTNDFGVSGKTGFALGAYLENFPYLLQKFFVRYDYNYYNSLIILPFEDTIQVTAGVVWGFSEVWGARFRDLPEA